MGWHARLGASTAKRWASCTGSVALIEGLPDSMRRKSSFYAAQGTAAHALLEDCLKTDREPRTYIGGFVEMDDEGDAVGVWISPAREPGPNDFEIDEEMADAVQVATDYVWGRMEECRALGDNPRLETETKVDFDWFRPDMGGTCDVCIDEGDGETLEVVDYKHGAGVVVEAEDNYQGRYYAFGKAKWHGFKHARVKITIIQPRGRHEEGPVRSEFVDMHELRSWADTVLGGAVDRIRSGATELRAGDWCKFCDALPVCPKARERTLSAAQADFAEEDIPDPSEEVKVPAGMTDEELVRDLRIIGYLDAWAKARKDYASKILMTGKEVKGLKLVRGNGRRTYKEGLKEAEIVASATKLGADEDALFKPRELKTGPQVEKLIPRKSRQQFNDECLVMNPGKVKVAFADDPRPEVKAEPGMEFDSLEE